MTLIYFIIMLGITIFIHELGHFLFAKKAHVHCYEFSLGMGPKLFGFRRKNDETEYCIRLFPIGGYVRMAGEEVEDDTSIDKGSKMQSKTFFQKVLIIIAGAMFNFILGILILFFTSLIYGSYEMKPILGDIDKNYNAYKEGLKKGDLILEVDNKKVSNWDDVLLIMETKKPSDNINLEVKDKNNDIKKYSIKPIKEKIDGKTEYTYGFGVTELKNYGFINSVKYSFNKFISICKSMVVVIYDLVTGKLGLDSLAGPVGIYNIVGAESKVGLEGILFLVGYLSINVGFVNLIPLPAFDGGRLLFLIIEKIRRKPISPRTENIIHMVGFGLLMILMVVITIHDVVKIFN